MKFPLSRNVLCSAAALILAANAPACHAPEVQTPGAQAVVAFKEQVVAYDALKGKLAASDPSLPKRATPQEVDTNQRSLAALVQSARADAKPGEFFTPEMQVLVKKVMSDVLTGPGGATVKASIMDENPGMAEIKINQQYPTSIPLSTMPPQVLESLPELKGGLEYRFIGPRLVLVDTEADIILDFTDPVLNR